ncbi:MAG: tetratricopeptide repeat protein [Planctomycetota bacterium]|jgi:hypothetical protein
MRKLPAVAALLALVVLTGCASTGESDASASGHTSAFDRLLVLERDGKYPEALRRYRSMAKDADRSPAQRIRAMVRAARCLEETRDVPGAIQAFEEVLSIERLMADENHLPIPGQVDIHLRLQAEEGLARIGGQPVTFYSRLARNGDAGEQLLAIRCIGRLQDSRGRTALNSVLEDEGAPKVLKDEAKDALESIDRAEGMRRKD